MKDATARYALSGEFVVRAIDGETVVVPIKGGVGDLQCIFTLNEVGARILQTLETRSTPQEIAAVIVSEFDVAPAQALKDVTSFLQTLQKAGLAKEEA